MFKLGSRTSRSHWGQSFYEVAFYFYYRFMFFLLGRERIDRVDWNVKNKHKFRFFRRWSVNTTLSGFWTNYGTLLETNYCQLSGGLISDIQASQSSQALGPHNSGLSELVEVVGGMAYPDFDSRSVNPISTGGGGRLCLAPTTLLAPPPRIVKSSYGSAH